MQQTLAAPASQQQIGPAWLSPKKTAAYLDVQEATLERWRVIGKGPRFRKLCGSVRYSIADIQEWIESCATGGAGQRTGVR